MTPSLAFDKSLHFL